MSPTEINEAIKFNLRSFGYYVIPHYLSRSECERLQRHIDLYMEKYPNLVQRDFKEGLGGDCRLFGLENTDKCIYDTLYHNEYFDALKTYTDDWQQPHREGKEYTLTPCTVMAGRISPSEDKSVKINSGGSWHRDPGTQYRTKVKTILYLNDVDATNGPFLVIPGSRVEQVGVGKVRENTEKMHQGLRICDDFVEELRKNGKEPVQITSEAGTMILIDVGHIHMGKQIEQGTRYTLTNYFQPGGKNSEYFKKNNKHFINEADK
jgi:hypothetical protein